ncbi:unnamed protein product, partial [Rotaria sp. Silwood1]
MFPLTTDVEPHFIQLGNHDPNEDYNHTGHSTTQRCKSHIFDAGNRQQLRIIDTPGFSNAFDQ